jgi:acyl-coenzyme A synthetase/AMP-(fatty) acid ligase
MWMGIGDAIEHWARYAPNKVALTVGQRRYNFKSLYDRAISIGLHVSEYRTDGRVAVGTEDKFEYLACLMGLHLARIPIVILNPHDSKEALNVHLTDVQPFAVIGNIGLLNTIDEETSRLLKEINILQIPTIINGKLSAKANGQEWGVLFSSGSTGISKAIVYDHMAMTSELLAWCLELGIRRETRFYVGRPIHYTGGLVLTLATLLVGGEVIMPDPKDDGDFEAIWNHYQNNLKANPFDFAFFVPDQIRTFTRIDEEPLGGPTILTMGAPISGGDKMAASHKLRSPVIESWGNSEGLGTITDKTDLINRPDSIGRPFLTEKVCVVTDALTECDIGQKGRLAGSQETMFTEYANRPDATDRVKKNNLVLSDDIGYMDKDHYFHIFGRDQESFIIDGKMIFISDMEDKVRRLSGISEACVVAVVANGAPGFHALIVPNGDILDGVIANAVNISLEVKINSVVFVKVLPRLPSGKIDRLAATKLVK